MSVAHWGESGLGEWKVEVFADDSHGDNVVINFKDWQFRIFGESIDADKAELYDLEKDYAAVRRELLEKGDDKPEDKQTTSSSETTKVETTEGQVGEETSIANGETTTSQDNSTTSTDKSMKQAHLPHQVMLNHLKQIQIARNKTKKEIINNKKKKEKRKTKLMTVRKVMIRQKLNHLTIQEFIS